MSGKVNLVEYIYPKMDILFLALNAPDVSNSNEHWFSYNLSFWNLLFESELISQRIWNKLEGDVKVFGDNSINYKSWIYGVTDLNRDVVQTNSSGILTTNAHVKRILDIIDNSKIKKLCLMHSKVEKQFEKDGFITRGSGSIEGYGKVGKYKDTIIYEVPFHNASISNKNIIYGLLKNKIEKQ